MFDWFVLAPGPSLSQDAATRLRDRNVIAVNNAYELAPWAAAMVANDRKWWDKHPDAKKFAGRKFCTKAMSGIERHRGKGVDGGSNSGMLGIDVAFDVFKADRVFLLGFDFHGSHFFGQYTNGCGNTTPANRCRHHQQMKTWRALHPDARVVNLTEGSELKVFPMDSLERVLHEP